MTGPSLSNAPETVVGSPLSDESALERHFRAHFSELCEEARGHLGEAASSAAPRVVESAFRAAWDERARFTSEADLAVFLHDAIRRCAARELSRRAAAHHLAGSASAAAHHTTAAPDVDQSWAHLTRMIHPETVRAEAQAHAEQLRHHAAEHVGDLSKPTSWKVPIAIGLVGGAIVLGAMWYVTSLGEEAAVTRALASTEARSLTAENGQTGRTTLDDGTQLTLAPGSKLTIPERFPADIRAVRIEGAARFVVGQGQDKPFEVRARDASIVANGTTLIVRAYPNDNAVMVQVRDGQATVKVVDADGEPRQLASGSAVVVDTSGTIREPSADELALGINWTDRRVTIRNKQLRDVVQEVNRFYGVDIKVPEMKALDRMASVDAPLDSMRAAIAQIENSANVTFGYEAQTMVFRAKDDSASKTASAATPRR
jgi:ferric-dicitrate binding protein FerR (iron transport regulator)